MAPYETNARKWEGLEWIDVHDPASGPYRITTKDGRPRMARVDTFVDVVAKYETHPEAKALGPDGEPCGRLTKGLLRRRPVTAGEIVLIGKEANRLEERLSGELPVTDLDQRLTIYRDDDEWNRITLPKLRELGARIAGETAGHTERRAREWLKGRSTPHPKTKRTLIEFVRNAQSEGK